VSTSEYQAQRPGPTASRLSWDAVREVPADIWALVALVALAAVIRVLVIDNQSFWMDEALTAYETHLGFGGMLRTVAHVETTPPLYFVLIWGWAHLFGSNEVALRSLSTIAGIALVPIAFVAARELVSRWAGVLAAAFVAVNPFLVWYSQEARAYMLLAALSGASFLCFNRAREHPTRTNIAWWTAWSALAVMTHFFAGFLVFAEALWLLWVSRTRAVIATVALLAVVQAAMLPLALTDTSHGANWIAHVPRASRVSGMVLEWSLSVARRRLSVPAGLAAGAAFVALLVVLIAVGSDRRTRAGAKVAAAIAGFVVVAPLVLGPLGYDYFFSRNEIPAVVPIATVVAAACAAPRARVFGASVAVGLLILFSWATIQVQTHASLERPDWRNVARALGPAQTTRAIYVANGVTADPLKIYLPHVSWVQPQKRVVRITEIDVVGALKRLPLAGDPTSTASPKPTLGRPVPRSVAPPGTRLIARFRVDSWIVARLALTHPIRINIQQLIARAPRYFRATPRALLLFFQQPGRWRRRVQRSPPLPSRTAGVGVDDVLEVQARGAQSWHCGRGRDRCVVVTGDRAGEPVDTEHHAAAAEHGDRGRHLDQPAL
jgi:mannosyltransferase